MTAGAAGLCYNGAMIPAAEVWPDPLHPPDPDATRRLPARFWERLAALPDLIERAEWLLAEALIADLRRTVLEMMLAANGIAYPEGTAHLNRYLGASQREALERTLYAEGSGAAPCIARAVALTVIYRWYAPQIAAQFETVAPAALEASVLADLARRLPDWPMSISTE